MWSELFVVIPANIFIDSEGNAMLRRIKNTSFIVLTLALALGRATQAQSTTGTVTGTVTDPGDAVAVGAQVTLTNTLTGLVKTGVTNRTGQYVLGFIPVGHYSLQAVEQGFNPEQRDNIDVSAGQSIQINFTLHVASASQTISVTS